MPIEIIDCDDGIGNIILTRGVVTDQELIDSLERHLTQDKEKFKKYKFILIDHTALTKMNITNETVEFIAEIIADTSRVNPNVAKIFGPKALRSLYIRTSRNDCPFSRPHRMFNTLSSLKMVNPAFGSFFLGLIY